MKTIMFYQARISEFVICHKIVFCTPEVSNSHCIQWRVKRNYVAGDITFHHLINPFSFSDMHLITKKNCVYFQCLFTIKKTCCCNYNISDMTCVILKEIFHYLPEWIEHPWTCAPKYAFWTQWTQSVVFKYLVNMSDPSVINRLNNSDLH